MSFRGGSSQVLDPHRVLNRRLSSEIVASALCPYDPLASLMSAYSSVPCTTIFPSVPSSTIYSSVPSSTIYHSVPSNAVYNLGPSSTMYSSVPLPSTICLPRLQTGGVLLDQPKNTTTTTTVDARMEAEDLPPGSHPLRILSHGSFMDSPKAFDHVICSSYPLQSSSDLDLHFSLEGATGLGVGPDNGGSHRRSALFQSLPTLMTETGRMTTGSTGSNDGWRVKVRDSAGLRSRGSQKEVEYVSRDVAAGSYVRGDSNKHVDVGFSSSLWRPY